MTLGSTVEAGQDNSVYVRMLNQGGSAATNVEATVFWSPVATLVTPDLWTRVGSTIVPNVLAGEQLTMSDAIVWDQAEIPGPGHYCLVGLIGNGVDPAPSPAEFLNFDNFRRFIRENNNVTWRNFNVEDSEPDVEASTFPRGSRRSSSLHRTRPAIWGWKSWGSSPKAPGPCSKCQWCSMKCCTPATSWPRSG